MKTLLLNLLCSIVCTLLLVSVTDGQVINTYAGGVFTGGPGDNGPATLARMETPSGICLDQYHNVYVSDQNDSRIRRIDTAGIITTVAGNGHAGYSGDGGPADSAELFYPEGVAIDLLGNIYIADQFNNVIRKVSRDTIYTIAGNNTVGDSGDGGTATNAQLAHPNDVAVDKWGNVYFVDQNNSRMKQIDTLGIIHNIAGTGVAGYNGDGISADTAQLNFPAGIAVDTSGNVYIADLYNYSVRKVDMSTGIITTVAGRDSAGYYGDGGPATLGLMRDPTAVYADHRGNLYITDYNNYRIRKVDSAGNIWTMAGSSIDGYGGDGGPATDAELNFPQGVTADDSGVIYIADYENARVRIVTKGTPLAIVKTPLESSCETIYPNPSYGGWRLNMLEIIQKDEITITDFLGKNIAFQYDSTTKTLDPGDLPEGMYLIRIRTGNNSTTLKAIHLRSH